MKKPVEFPLIVKEGSVSAKIYRTPSKSGYNSFTLVYYQDSVRKREVFGLQERFTERRAAARLPAKLTRSRGTE